MRFLENANTKKSARFIGLFAFCVAMAANAATSITIDSVRQRWPWNNKIDITYTVTDGQTLTSDPAGDVYAKIVFNATIGGQAYTIDGVSDVGASAASGTHTVTWSLPAGIAVKDLSCSMTATISTADAPSGDDYMVVDLDTGAVAYEGMLFSQELSNSRYNTDTYKTGKLVLRKVPRWAEKDSLPNASALAAMTGYPTGHEDYASQNSVTHWATKKSFYAGVFLVTQSQYSKVYGSNPSETKVGNLYPVNMVSWNDLRVTGTAPSDSIPAVTSKTGTFFQRLNYLTGNKYGFDLGTEVMFEIAERAGAKTVFFWGDSVNKDYFVCKGNNGDAVMPVGSVLPNNWGLYNMAGNLIEWCRDDASYANVADAPDAFTPAWSGHAERRRKGGNWNGSCISASKPGNFAASARLQYDPDASTNGTGFRVFMIAD